jgi:hypothetical protein
MAKYVSTGHSKRSIHNLHKASHASPNNGGRKGAPPAALYIRATYEQHFATKDTLPSCCASPPLATHRLC